MLLFIILLFALLFISTSSARVKLCLLLGGGLLTSFLLASVSSSLWMSFLLALIYLGGLMVLFGYTILLPQDNKGQASGSNLLFTLLALPLTLLFEPASPPTPANFSVWDPLASGLSLYFTLSLYLLLTLFSLLQFLQPSEGSLRPGK